MDEQPDLIAQLDQLQATLRSLAKATRAAYEGHVEAGFSKREAFELAKAWFLQTTTGDPNG